MPQMFTVMESFLLVLRAFIFHILLGTTKQLLEEVSITVDLYKN
jgi:hypothetical protein